MTQESIRGNDADHGQSNQSDETTGHHFWSVSICHWTPDRRENANVSDGEDHPVLQIVVSLLSNGIDGSISGEVRNIVDNKRSVEEVKMEVTEDRPCLSNPLLFFVSIQLWLTAVSTPFFVF